MYIKNKLIMPFMLLAILLGCFMLSACGSTGTQGSSVPAKSSAAASGSIAQTAIKFVRLPFNTKNVGAISPLGMFSSSSRANPDLDRPYGNHVHLVWNKTPGTTYEVYAPASLELTAYRSFESYRLDFGSNNLFYYFDGIVMLEPSLEAKINSLSSGGSIEYSSAMHALTAPITIEAGTLLGYTGWKPASPEGAPLYWEWGLVDKSYTKGINNPNLYYSWMFPFSRSVYDLATTEVQSSLSKIAGKWDAANKKLSASKRIPPLGSFGNDQPNNICGMWYYNKDDNEKWGPKIAIFAPNAMDNASQQIRLSVPELNIYGSFTGIATQEAGRVNRYFHLITQESGIWGYTLDNGSGGENGFLLVSLIEKNKIRIETLKDYLPSLEAYTASEEVFYFTKKAVELYR
jgi:hypothetical protein